jgi:hypothetical protein
VLGAQSPGDARVHDWLAESVRLDPYGPESWRRHLDLARLAARLGREPEVLPPLLAAVLLNPAAVAELPRRGAGEALVLHPGGLDGPGVPVQALLDALAERRARPEDLDPDEAARLRLRGIEVLQALGEFQAADALAQELLADNAVYLQTRTAQTRLAEGRYEEAAERLRGILPHGAIWIHGDLLEALSHATPLDEAAFDTQLAATEAHMAHGVDVVFDIASVRKIRRARQRCAERGGDLAEAVRLADASAFAQR